MTELVKPTAKSRHDGKIDMLNNGDAIGMLVMIGDYTAEQMLDAAIKAGLIPENERDAWEPEEPHTSYYQSWFKAVPDGSGFYSTYHHPRNTPCRGAYFASVIYRY